MNTFLVFHLTDAFSYRGGKDDDIDGARDQYQAGDISG